MCAVGTLAAVAAACTSAQEPCTLLKDVADSLKGTVQFSLRGAQTTSALDVSSTRGQQDSSGFTATLTVNDEGFDLDVGLDPEHGATLVVTFAPASGDAAATGAVRVCFCPDDHPFAVVPYGYKQCATAAEPGDSGKYDSIPLPCVDAVANVTVRAFAAPVCTGGDPKARICARTQSADITIAPQSGLPVTGQLSIDFEKDFVPCGSAP